MSLKYLAMPLVVAILFTAGCGNTTVTVPPPEQPADTAAEMDVALPIGERCMVKFRPDFCGGTSDSFVSWDTTMQNGADLTVSGELLGVDEEWVVIRASEPGSPQYWLPREAVFFIRATPPRKPSNATAADAAAEHADSGHADSGHADSGH